MVSSLLTFISSAAVVVTSAELAVAVAVATGVGATGIQ